MDVVLMIVCILLLLASIAGSILPALPGPPIGFAALVISYFTTYQPIGVMWLWVYGIITLIISLVDFWLPTLAARFTGASTKGVQCANIGMVAGLFIPIPFALFVGAFAGAVLGELMNKKPINFALKAAFGVLLGLVGGVLLKTLFCVVMLLHVIIGLLF